MIHIFRVEKQNDPEVQRTENANKVIIIISYCLAFYFKFEFSAISSTSEPSLAVLFFVLLFCFSAMGRNNSILNL